MTLPPNGEQPLSPPPAGAPQDPVILDAAARPLPRSGTITLTAQTVQFSGPLPPPELLAEYERLFPGAAERMMRQVELQSAHRREIEHLVVKGNVRDSRLGIVAGVLVALGCLAVAGYAVRRGHPTVAITIATATIGTLAGTFVYGTRAAQKDLATKRPPAAPAAPPPAPPTAS